MSRGLPCQLVPWGVSQLLLRDTPNVGLRGMERRAAKQSQLYPFPQQWGDKVIVAVEGG